MDKIKTTTEADLRVYVENAFIMGWLSAGGEVGESKDEAVKHFIEHFDEMRSL